MDKQQAAAGEIAIKIEYGMCIPNLGRSSDQIMGLVIGLGRLYRLKNYENHTTPQKTAIRMRKSLVENSN